MQDFPRKISGKWWKDCCCNGRVAMLEFQNVNIKRGEFMLKEISFQLEEGYILGIVGKNGAGKSTLLKSMLEPKKEDTGTILWNGEYVREKREWFLSQCAYIGEDNNFFLKRSASENVTLLSTVYPEVSEEAFFSYMKEMKVSTGTLVGAYSRGQFIRFQMAFARARGAKLYLLDEVTAGMDPVFRREFYQMLREILSEGATILMTTHISTDIQRMADYVLELEEGRMLYFKENLYEQEE